MFSELAISTCDVIGCAQIPTKNYLDLRRAQAFKFRVCSQHFELLESGVEPVIVDKHLEPRQLIDGRPSLLLE